MNNKKVSLNDILERISKIEARLEEIAPISKRKLPSKKEQIEQIQSEIHVWSQKFPSTDIEFELAKMLDWLKATNKRKKDYRAFFRNWLRKSTNSVGNEPTISHSYIYSCANDKAECVDEISNFKDMSYYCTECNTIKKIIKVTKS
ncbi:MAG: hypothetical protein H8E74_01915 [Gammaproteobacteria bacterium]|jgi:hypothetical protein|nr:hypothetical protein [Gammaproteobacteria bacterium]MBT4317324.1 hypothetical protein [Candidatus Neomarinimicrobiota bacterium]MBT6867520.1 hypothetical protein [Candidatus Neomarinimicrobiota bacterium]MBT7172570.1 hypothetical protein [Candidatus Neomarinimicrobiota bacterium]MBT7434266.1 hypothetical protein [Candidatus Neomarinimicrobiota bacterium]